MFHPTALVDCLDIDASKVMRLPFRPETVTSVLTPVFFADKTPSEGLFAVPQCPHGDIYVCENIKMLVKKHKLKGLVLRRDTFSKPWIS